MKRPYQLDRQELKSIVEAIQQSLYLDCRPDEEFFWNPDIEWDGAETLDRISDRELATLLAALRFWQRHGQTDADLSYDVASDGGRLTPLCNDEIDRLCERLNFGSKSTAACDG